MPTQTASSTWQFRGRTAKGLVVALVLAGCLTCARRDPPASNDPAVLLQAADDAYLSQPVSAAAALARDGMNRFPDKSKPWYWQFRGVLERALLEKGERPEEEKLPDTLRDSDLYLRSEIMEAFNKGNAENCRSAADKASARGWQEAFAEAQLCDAVIHINRDELDEAERLLLKAEARARANNNNRELTSVLSNRLLLYARTYRNHEVEPVAQEALSRLNIDRRRQAKILANLGYNWYTLGDIERARDYLDKAEKLARELEHSRTILNSLQQSARVVARSDPKQALLLAEQSLQYLPAKPRPGMSSAAQAEVAFFAIKAGDLDKARRAARIAVREAVPAESNPQLDYVRAKLAETPPTEFERIASDEKAGSEMRLEAMLELALRARAAGPPAKITAAFDRILRFGETERARIRTVEQRIPFISNLMPGFNAYVNYLVSTGRDREALAVADSSRALVFSDRSAARSHRLNLAALQAELGKKDAVAVSFWMSPSPSQSHAWVITGRGLDRVDLPAEAEIRARVNLFRDYLQSASDTPLTEAPPAKDMAAMMQPLCAKLAGATRIVAVLDGPFHDIGIDTLPCDGRPLIESASLEIAPALWILNQQHAKWSGPGNALLVGAASQVTPEFPALPGADAELRSIASLMNGGQSTLVRGADANPGAVRSMPLAGYGMIHFAAHAAANRLNPLESAIVLSKSGEGEYQLFARQILDLKLNHPLVTLSACRSAGARSFSGEGFVGLTWAFLQSGAQGVVAGLWAVDDAASQKVMNDFYTLIREGKPPLTALTETKRKYWKSGPPMNKPFYWAGWQYFTSSL